MYRKIQDSAIINDLWIIPFEVLSKNLDAKFKCEQCFPNELNNNSRIIYNSSDDGIVVLGYYNLDDLNITSFSMFENVKNITLSFYGIDNVEKISQTRCSHICSWVFDYSLKTNEQLKKIVESIVLESKKTLLWFEYNNDLIFYPIENYPLAINYFIKAFGRQL